VATITTRKRNKLPAKDFAGPDRSYPVNDRGHAANAKARASQAVKAGRISRSEEAKIDQKANRVLERGKNHESHERPDHPEKARHGMEITIMLHPKTTGGKERASKAKEENSLPVPRREREHAGSKGYNERERGEKKMAGERRAEAKRVTPERMKEPKREAKAHERAGEKKHMAHERTVKSHEREGEHRAMEEKAEKKHGGAKVVHHHHHHHHGAK